MRVKLPLFQFGGGDVQQVLVVGEENNLRLFTQLRQHFQGRGGPLVVQLNQNVVQHKGKRPTTVDVGFQTGQSQRQEQRVCREGVPRSS